MTVGEPNVPLAAARAVACAHGVRCEDAVVIAAGSNVLVHLKPAPIVARVMTGTVALHDDIARWLEREVAVGAFVAERGGPVVPPSDLIAPGPYQQYGFWMTFWKFVAHESPDRAPDAREVGRSLRELHTVLVGFAGDLEPLSSVCTQIERQIAELRTCPWLSETDIELLRSELGRLTPTVFETSLPAQPIHGDAGLSNLLQTSTRLLWNDLEDVCAGPVAWDVAGLAASARARGRSDSYVEDVLDGYGCPDVTALAPFLDADALYAAVWQAFDTQRRQPARTTAPTRLAQWLGRSAGSSPR
jgi:Phosphotransferase enzyme family